jgi:hypothetical protein
MRPRGNTQEDYLLRIIRQAAELLRQLRRRLLGGEASADDIRRDAATAIEFLLGSQASLLAMLDPGSAVRLVGHPSLVGLWAALLDVEADAAEAGGDATVATRRRARAIALREAAREAWGATRMDEPAEGSRE